MTKTIQWMLLLAAALPVYSNAATAATKAAAASSAATTSATTKAAKPAAVVVATPATLATVSPASGMPSVPAATDASTYLFLSEVRNPTQLTVTVGLQGNAGPVMTLAQKLLPGALQQLANATGNTFNIFDMAGRSIPTRAQQNCKTSVANILIIVGDSTNGPLNPTAGEGGNHGVTSNSGAGGHDGYTNCSVVVINAGAVWSNLDYDPEHKSVGHTLLHELGHTFGLDHPVAGGQVMHNAPLVVNGKKASDTFTNKYAAGDLYGLYAVTKGKR